MCYKEAKKFNGAKLQKYTQHDLNGKLIVTRTTIVTPNGRHSQ